MQFPDSSSKSSLNLRVPFINRRCLYLVSVIPMNAILEAVHTEYTGWINCTVSARKMVTGEFSKAKGIFMHRRKYSSENPD